MIFPDSDGQAVIDDDTPTIGTGLVVQNTLLGGPQEALVVAGHIANVAAARRVFENYRSRKSAETLRRQDGDLELFAKFLTAAHIPAPPLSMEYPTWGALLARLPSAWTGVTWGLVAGFVEWMVATGYTVGSINVRLSTVKIYAKLAAQGGGIESGEYAQIRGVTGYGYSEGINLNQKRQQTRVGHKKALGIFLNKIQVLDLKRQPDTPVGHMVALMMAIFLDHGLRLGELEMLQAEHFDLAAGTIHFWREKVKKFQTHELTPDALRAAYAYIGHDVAQQGPLWFKTKDGTSLLAKPLGERDIRRLVQKLGQQLPGGIAVASLSPHDLRHTWATLAARSGTSVDKLQEAGGWNSPAMPLQYIEAAAIANQGVLLS